MYRSIYSSTRYWMEANSHHLILYTYDINFPLSNYGPEADDIFVSKQRELFRDPCDNFALRDH
jgi:hypothetical protein